MNQLHKPHSESSQEKKVESAATTTMSPVQEKELGVLKEVIKVIEENGLHYCAVGGTCLGAVRHKGFIPWDDDIDIVLPRTEYELFRTELYKQLPAHLKKMDGDVSRSHDFLFMKIHDSRTTQIELYAKNSPDRITGAFVDIFPLDGIPSGHIAQKLWLVPYTFLVKCNYLRRNRELKPDNLKKMIKLTVHNILRRITPPEFFLHKLEKFGRHYDIENYSMVQCNAFSARQALAYGYKKSYFYDTILMDFEDIQIRVPRQYDEYLTKTYHDYMKLPPENERVWHHVYISDMETPCAYYAERIRKELAK